MARRFTTGAEEPDVLGLWDNVLTLGSDNQIGMPTFGRSDQVSWAPRTGRGMYVMNSTEYLQNLTADNPTELYFGFAVRFSALAAATFFVATNDTPGTFTNYCSLYLNANGSISLNRVTTALATSPSALISADTWYYMEVWLKPLNSNGRFVLKVDGSIPLTCDVTGDTTNDLELISAYQFKGIATTTLTSFDDIVVNDASTGVNNTYPGMVRLLPIRGRSVGQYDQWVRGGVDLGSNPAQVSGGGFDFSMLQTPNADYKSTFVPDIPDLPAGATIKNVALSTKARVQSGAGVLANMLRANGTDSISADHTLTSSWKYYQDVWSINPEDSGAWAEADLANLQIGVSS